MPDLHDGALMPKDKDLEAQVKQKNIQFFVKKLVLWFVPIIIVGTIASLMMYYIPEDSDIVVVYALWGFLGFIMLGILISRIAGFKHFIARHGIIVENSPEIQEVIKEETTDDLEYKDHGYACPHCGNMKLYVHPEGSGVCGECGIAFHKLSELKT